MRKLLWPFLLLCAFLGAPAVLWAKEKPAPAATQYLKPETIQKILRDAGNLMKQEDYREASRILEAATSQAENPVPLLLLLSKAYVGMGETNDAIGILRQALELDEACADCAITLSNLLGAVGEVEKGKSVLRRSLQLKPLDPALTQALEKLEKGEIPRLPRRMDDDTRKKMEEAKRAIDRQVAIFQPKKGEELLLEKNYEAAAMALENELKDTPKDAEKWTNLGVAQDGMGLFEKSAESHKKALEIDPNFEIAWNNLGHAQEMQEQYQEAKGSYEKAIAISASYTLSMQNLANTLLKMGLVDDSIRVNQEAIAIDPKDPAPHNNLAFAYFKKGYCKNALSSLEQAKTLDKDHETVHENIAFIKDAQSMKTGPCLADEPETVALKPGLPKEPGIQPVDPGNAIVDQSKPKGPGVKVVPVKPLDTTPPFPPGKAPGAGSSEAPTTFAGQLVLGLLDGRIVVVDKSLKLQVVGRGRLPTATKGVQAWLYKQDIGYGLAIRRSGKTTKVDSSPGYKKNPILSTGGSGLAWQSMGAGGGLKFTSIGGGKTQSRSYGLGSYTWQDAQNLLVLGAGCSSGGSFDICLRRVSFTGPDEELVFQEGGKNLFYTEGERFSQVKNGVFYAPSAMTGGSLVRVDLNQSTVTLQKFPALERVMDSPRAVAQNRDSSQIAVGIGTEVWIMQSQGSEPLKIRLGSPVQTVDWVD